MESAQLVRMVLHHFEKQLNKERWESTCDILLPMNLELQKS